jgi:signal transduction histidine kinase/CheY-like chemotaxis protein/PAS domain-containing protein
MAYSINGQGDSPLDLKLLNQLQTPLWIFDVDNIRFWWGNTSALALWRTKSLDEFRLKDFSTLSTQDHQHLRNILTFLEREEFITRKWIFLPQEDNLSAFCRLSIINIESGRRALFCEVIDSLNSIQEDALRALKIIETTPTILSVYDQEGQPILRNKSALSRYSSQALVQQFVNPNLDFRSLFQPHQMTTIEAQVNTLKGIRWHEVDIRSFQDPITTDQYYLMSEIDINEHKFMEEDLYQAHARNTAILNGIPDLILTLNREGMILDCQPDSCFSNAWKEDTDPVGKLIKDLLPADIGEHQMIQLEVALKEQKIQIFEQKIYIKDKWHYEELRMVPLSQETVLLIVRNITERKESEANLCKRENYLSALVQIQQKLLANEFDDDGYQDILSILGKTAQASRVYLFENHLDPAGTLLTSQRSKWWTDEILLESNCPQFQNLSWLNFFPAWGDTLAKGNIIHNLASDLPPEERRILEQQGVESVLILPLMVSASLWGFIEFENRQKNYSWDPLEVQFLNAAATAISFHLELCQIRKDILQAKDEAEQANQAKTSFLATMSHEIRTPLNAVLGMASVLNTTSLNQKQKEYVDIIQKGGELLLTVINDILDFSKIEANRLELDLHPFRLASCVEDVIQLFQPEAQAKRLTLSAHLDPNIPPILIGDAHRLRQVLVNLVGNAIKFTEEGGVRILVVIEDIQTDKCRLQFSIQDTGIGISSNSLKCLFQPFSQLDASITRRYGGTGLGLAICRRLCQLMGGDICVDSTPGQGSTFFFTLEFSKGSTFPQKLTSSELDLLPSHLRILVVEDNLVNQKVILALLESLGYQADVASHGIEALKILKNRTYDLIFMDLQIPEMDGITTAKQIRSGSVSQPRIVAMTAHALQEVKEHCLAAGMDDYISKPIQMSDLLKILRYPSPSPNNVSLSSPAESPLELTILKILEENVGSTICQDIIHNYLLNTPKLLCELQKSYAAGDIANIRHKIHDLKASSGMIGGYRLMQLCKKIEQEIRQGSVIADHLPLLLQEYQDLARSLQAEAGQTEIE